MPTPRWRRPYTVRSDARPAATPAFAVAPASLKFSSSTMPCALASRRERPTARSRWPDSATAWRRFIRTACAKSSAGRRALMRCCAWQGADMPRFRYSAFTSAGLIERGEIDCLTRADSLSVLSARGLVPFESTEAEGPPISGQRASLLGRTGRSRLKIYADLTRELSVLLAADIPLDASLRLLVQQRANRRLGALAERLLAAVTAGEPLSGAIASADPEAPAVLAGLLRAGEARGSLAPTLVDLAAIFESRIEMQGKIRSALTYPIILCITALGAIAIIITVLVPAMMPIFDGSGALPPLVLRLAHQLGQIITHQGHLIAIGMIAVVLSGRALMR